jgi:hypothetical protein
MRASFVDLRKKSRQIIDALRRKEEVTVYYRGKPAAVMRPLADGGGEETVRASDHPAFGMWTDREDMTDVAAHIRDLRKARFSDL